MAGEKNPTELINLEVINLIGTGDVCLWSSACPRQATNFFYEIESQEQEVAIVPPFSHGKGDMGHLYFACYFFRLEVCLIHSSISVKSKFHML